MAKEYRFFGGDYTFGVGSDQSEPIKSMPSKCERSAEQLAEDQRRDAEYRAVHNAKIITPEREPNHHTVGQHFRAYDGNVYWCDSYDPRWGYWMTRLDAPVDFVIDQDQTTEWRRNVSVRAINRTFHLLHDAVDGARQFHRVNL